MTPRMWGGLQELKDAEQQLLVNRRDHETVCVSIMSDPQEVRQHLIRQCRERSG